MEHRLCLDIPRLGELIAFRKVFDHLPQDVAMDEAFVEALIIRRGMEVRYAPDAVVHNMGPETVSDFVRQRRRNYAGHLYLKAKYGYRVSSLENVRVVRIAFEEVWAAVRLVWTLGIPQHWRSIHGLWVIGTIESEKGTMSSGIWPGLPKTRAEPFSSRTGRWRQDDWLKDERLTVARLACQLGPA